MSYFLEHLFFTFPSIMLFVVHFMFLVQLYLRFVLAFFTHGSCLHFLANIVLQVCAVSRVLRFCFVSPCELCFS